MAVALILDHPLALLSLLAGLVAVGLLTGSGRLLARTAVWTLPMAVTVALLNALLSRDGLTVVARLGELPVLGRLDVTLEGLAYGGVLALRVTLVAAAVAVFAACVDQDSVVGLLRRRSGRFGIAIALAGRMAPLLAADASASTGRKPGVGCCSDGLLTPYTAIKACSEKHDWVSREGVGVGVASRGRASNDASMQHAP
jgi:energy-coupling factor transport system permease protein